MWDAWFRLLTNGASVATIASFLYVFKGDMGRRVIVAAALFILSISVLTVVDFVRSLRSLPKTYPPNDPRINNYMRSWLSRGGLAVVFSRDLSWANDASTKKELKGKANRNELILCIPKATPLTRELRKLGATVYEYASNDFTPQSRFTIINYGRDDARVAVGRVVGSKHTINEFQAGHHPLTAVASDLVEIVRMTANRRRNSR